MKYRLLEVMHQECLYLSTVSVAMVNGQKRNQSMSVIQFMTFHLHQMLVEPIIFLELLQRISTFIAFDHPRTLIVFPLFFSV